MACCSSRSNRITAALLFLAFSAAAQFKPASPPEQTPGATPKQAGQAAPPIFSVKVNLVRLLVSVRDGSGALLTNLGKQDFRVQDSNVPQEIAVFERNTSVPLSVAILVDTSGSTQIDLQYEVSSVLKFIP